MDIKGKTAVVTGASRGIGKAISIELARQGIKHLILVARDRQKLAEVATEIATTGVKVTTLSLDLTQPASINIARQPVVITRFSRARVRCGQVLSRVETKTCPHVLSRVPSLRHGVPINRFIYSLTVREWHTNQHSWIPKLII